MSIRAESRQWLAHESRALLTRLDLVKPFALHETMVPAAAPSLAAQSAIDRKLVKGRRELRHLVADYLTWLQGSQGRSASVAEAQRRFVLLRLQFNNVMTHFDIFADVMTQRSEHETGVWLAGLDALAADAITLPGGYFAPPPVVCYLDRGHGAAIRRARTRLPGGGENPVAIIRVPRERMVGSGIASSLVHEVGHQGAALLNLVNSIRPVLCRLQHSSPAQSLAWRLWERWISEILADLWSVARVGVTSTLGLKGVVSLPRAFVFRVGLDDPHPFPWIRVKLSCAMGNALYPHPQWARLASMWELYYPLAGLDIGRRQLLGTLEAGIPDFVTLLISHRPEALRGKTLGEAMATSDRHPERLRIANRTWRAAPDSIRQMSPSMVFAMIGQARADGKLVPEEETRVLSRQLIKWALRGTLNRTAICAEPTQPQAVALAT
jgi:hypothetical protein